MSNNFDKIIKKNGQKITLNCAIIGKSYKIVECFLPSELKNRLFEMGLTPKTVVCVQKRAPTGDPLEIFVRGYSLCIRVKDAAKFVVEEVF